MYRRCYGSNDNIEVCVIQYLNLLDYDGSYTLIRPTVLLSTCVLLCTELHIQQYQTLFKAGIICILTLVWRATPSFGATGQRTLMVTIR